MRAKMMLTVLILLLTGGNAAAQVHVEGNVFGGGNLADVGGNVTVNISAGTVDNDVYGGGAKANTNTGNWDFDGGTEYVQVNVTVDETVVTGMYTESGGTYTKITAEGTKAKGNTTYYKKVGVWKESSGTTGGYIAATSTTTSSTYYKTTVNLLGGTITGNAYGGGLGEGQGATGTPAYVYGDVKVNLNGLEAATDIDETTLTTLKTGNNARLNENNKVKTSVKGCAVTRVFGCNNLNGTPKGHVKVNVYATQNSSTTSTSILPKGNSHTDKETGTTTTYDVTAVYGGGNLSPYDPVDAYSTNNDVKLAAKTEVLIDGCGLTSIKQVYGGGNAASAPATYVRVDGTFEIEELFGGGNGNDDYQFNGKWYKNPGANVGYTNYTHLDGNGDGSTASPYTCVDNDNAKTKAGRQTEANGYMYGSGIAQIEVFGGKIFASYGGSNKKGNVRVEARSKYEEAGDCALNVVETYGGGKDSEIDGVINLNVGCVKNMDQIFGGSKNAPVYSDIVLNIHNGHYHQVFGGNNTSGAIHGSITVNIEEKGCVPIDIDELYIGGYLAPYSIYGYKNDGTPLKEGDTGALETPYKQPRLNVISASRIGDIFGGGYQATVVGDPHVNVNMEAGKVEVKKTEITAADAATDEYSAYAFSESEKYYIYTYKYYTSATAYTEYKVKNDVISNISGKYYAPLTLGTIENVYGGGNEANIVGDTYVEIGTGKWLKDGTDDVWETKDDAGNTYTFEKKGSDTAPKWYKGDDAQESAPTPRRKAAKISGDVFGGGQGVNTGDATDVDIAKVEGNTNIQFDNGTIAKSVYGGGKLAQVSGTTTINITGGTATTVIGTTGEGGATYGNVYGGGFGHTADKLFGRIMGNTNVNISGGAILHNVYGGGAYGSVGTFSYDTAEMPSGLSTASTGTTNVTITGGTIGTNGNENGMVFGSSRGDVATPTGTPAVDPNDKLAWVYDANVIIGTSGATTGPQINGSVYGSGENGHTYHDADVKIYSGTIGIASGEDIGSYSGAAYPYRGNVYGGGCGTDMYDSNNDGTDDTYNPLAGIVRGAASVTINGGQVVHNVYGAGAIGSVGTMTKATNGDVTITSGGTTTIAISGGIVGVDGADGGNVFGAARGDETTEQTDVALVKTTNVNISGDAKIKGNVYGGGQAGDVGTYHTVTEEGLNKGNNNYLGGDASGVCNVVVTGGTIGTATNTTAGHVFGAGKGAGNTYTCQKAMVKETSVTISNGTIYGDVYGGGEVGRVEHDSKVTIGLEPVADGSITYYEKSGDTYSEATVTAGTTNVVGKYIRSGVAGSYVYIPIVTSDVPTIYGNVFGAGAGLETHGYSALVRGNSTVTIGGGAAVRKNVYGGGKAATVGKYWVSHFSPDPDEAPPAGFPDGMPYKTRDGGFCRVTIQGQATIGPASGDASEEAGQVFGAGKGVSPSYSAGVSKRMNDQGQWEYFDGATGLADYFQFLETLALASNTVVTVNGATVKGSVFGGSESGFVQDHTTVTVNSGTIGTETTPTYGNVFGGGKGIASFAEAGRVRGNTTVAFNGGTAYGSVYGGGKLGDVGTIDKTDIDNYTWSGYDTEITTDDTGICTVSVTGGTVQKNVFGAGKGSDITFQCEKAMAYKTEVSVSNGTVIGNIYGGGEVGRVENDTQVTIGRKTGETEGNGTGKPDIKGSVFGAGKGLATHGYSALVRGNTAVTVEGASGAKVGANVYGGGEIASVGRYGLNAQEMPNILLDGGRCIVKVLGNAVVGPQNASDDKGNVFGAGRGVDTPYDNSNKPQRMTLDNNGQSVLQTINSEEDYQTFLETLALATAPDVTIGGNATVNGSVFGGGELGLTKGAVIVKINGGTIEKDVYGGGALAHTNTTNQIGSKDNTGAWVKDSNGNYVPTTVDYPTTTVSLLGGIIRGEAYGGGLGNANTAAYVYGDVLVDLNNNNNGGDVDVSQTGCIVSQVFGANNVNGTPKGNVTVHVYGTQNKHASKTTIGAKFALEKIDLDQGENESAAEYLARLKTYLAGRIDLAKALSIETGTYQTTHDNSSSDANAFKTAINGINEEINDKGSATINALRYDVKAVYGGGNQAIYDPVTTWNGTTGSKTQVIIDGCSATSVETVYGGGNAAAVPETNVTVHATYEIGSIFGGGNGKDDIAPGVANPGADVGTKDHGETTYGTGDANTLLEGGLIHEVYGGSNQKGIIKGSINQTTNPDGSTCELEMDKVVGAGKYADIDGDVNMTLSCQPSAKVPLLFAGADEANVNGNITLNITNGHFGQVFGGNNLGGVVKGKITVNVQETGCQPIKIDELYLGGNEAAYSVFGYYISDETHSETGKKILKPRESATDTRKPVKHDGTEYASISDFTNYAQPELNIISCTYIGKVFGGGLGSPAKMYANPTVNVNMVPSSKYADGIPTFMNSLGLDDTKTAPNPTKIGIIGDVFGGGNAADIVGNTTVNIAVEYVVKQVFVGDNVAGYYTRSGAGTTADPFVYTAATGTALEGKTYYEKKAAQGSAYIIGSVFGGGNAADVLGNTNVRMSDGYVFNGIFGGGYAGNVGTFTRSFADADVNVFGHTTHEGCIGKPTACAKGTGKCTVVVDGGQIGPIEVATEGMNRSVTDGGPVPQGWVWGAGQGLIEDPAKEPDTHFKSYVGSTDVTIGGTALIMESIIGGGEFGRVFGDTKVTITGQCQIGVGEGKVDTNNKPIRYTDDQFVNPLTTTITNDNALVECSHFPYGEDTDNDGIKDRFLPYDPYYDDNKTYADAHDLGPASTSDPSDGKTWIGCVFAGGSGYMPYLKKDNNGNNVGYDWCSSAGLVEGNTNLTISGGHILTNVYGGNEVTNVKGTCKITMTGGTIGVPRTVDQIIAHPLTCYLFGAGKGDQRPHFNTETNVGEVEINISGGIIYGSVFGGGEDGHVQRDVNLTIQKGEDFTIGGTTYTNGPIIGTWGTSYVDGNVFGGGRGFGGDAYTAGNVAGSVDVKIKGGNILGSIYGGGRLGSVGYGLYPPGNTYYGAMRPDDTDDDASNTHIDNFKRGYVDIEISGGTIGNRHEYIIPSADNTPSTLDFDGIATWSDDDWKTWGANNNIPLTEFDHASYRLKHTKGGNVFAGGMGRLYQLDGTTPITSVDWWKLGCVKSTKLTIKGGTIKSNVYGGGELGQVVGYHSTQNAANDNINAGTEIIIQGNSTTTPTIGTEIQSGSGSEATTQYTFGSVFGGGYGSLQEEAVNGKYPKLIAGLVKKDTKIDMQNGAVKASIYGGGEMASVGESTTSGETTTATGSTYVAVSGGTIGIAPITVGTTTRNFGGATMGNVYGGGSGHGNTVRSGKIFKNTNVTISGSNTRIYHNIYGGGAYGTVGDFDYDVDGENKVTKVNNLKAPGGVATVTITGGTIGYDGKNNGMVYGSSRGDINAPGKRDDYTAWVYDTHVTIGETNGSTNTPLIKGSVYGSGENGHTYNDAAVTIHSGTIGVHDGTAADGTRGNVYGAGCGTDKYYSDPTQETHDGDGQLYNPKAGIVQGTATITINGGHVLHNVYGAGAMGPVGIDGVGHKTTVNINGGRIGYDGNDNGNVYGGARGDQGIGRNFAYVGDTEVNINYADTPDGDNEGKTEKLIAGSVFGGGEAGSVHGGIVVNMNKGLVLNDVYGGGALADTNTDNWGTTTWAEGKTAASNITAVNLKGGTVTGNVYGGGLGKMAVGTEGQTGYEPAIEAKVYGNTTVELNNGVADEAKGCIVKGSIFGCNNMSGSPQGTTTVHIYKTQRDGASRITNTTEVTNAKVKGTKTGGEYVPSSFDVQAVYGGGNMAAFEPVDLTTGTTNVIIDGCERTSICHVYGGGNAASTPATNVTINGTYEIGELFGGGNGKDDIVKNNVTLPNPGANVGYKDYSEYYSEDEGVTWKVKDAENATTKEDRLASSYVYGTGVATVNVFGGLVHRVFGGSNTKGNVRQTALTLLDENNDCPFCVDEAYGGGKSAEMDAEAKLLMACIPGLQAAYGGAEEADVHGNVTLNITNGSFDRVFGGNNLSGTISGSITVNIEEIGCRPIKIGELYGGGNQAGYSVYGYNADGTPKESGTKLYDDPQVNVKSFTSIGKVFGGGYGSGATMVGNPTVSVNEVYGRYYNQDVSVVGEDAKTSGNYPIPSHEKGKMGAISEVFGGGNAAKVIGNTMVNIATLSDVYIVKEVTAGATLPADCYTRSGEGTTASPFVYTPASGTASATVTYYEKKDVLGVDIRGNVYGGGNNAEVTGNTNVVIGREATTTTNSSSSTTNP